MSRKSRGRGNHGANLGMTYWTVKVEDRYQAYLLEQDRLEKEHQAAVRERRRIGNVRRQARWRAKRKAAGLPLPKRKPEPPGASTIRTRRFRERQRVKKAAEQAAALVAAESARLAIQRERQAASRARRKQRAIEKAIRAEAYLLEQWFSPEISERAAKAIIEAQHPEKDANWVHSQYVHLDACARVKNLNVNAFTLAPNGEGIDRAEDLRAVFYEIQRNSNRLDYAQIVKDATAIQSLRNMPDFQLENETRVRNALSKSFFYAQGLWGRGEVILAAVRKQKL
jgi:hypothetical protein